MSFPRSFAAGVSLLALAAAACGGYGAAPTATIAPTLTAPTPEASVGSAVGQRAPPFAFTLGDGTRTTSDELQSAGQPAVLYFMATW